MMFYKKNAAMPRKRCVSVGLGAGLLQARDIWKVDLLSRHNHIEN